MAVLVGVEVADLLLDGVGRQVVLHDHVHEVIGESGMNPHEDGEVGLHPGGVVGSRIVGVNMRPQIETPKNNAKIIAPATIGCGLHVKSYGNETLDVDAVGGQRGRSGGSGNSGARDLSYERGHGSIAQGGRR